MGMTVIAMVAVLSGCGKKPQVEIDATNAAIEAAKAAEADVYLPAEFSAVQDSMQAVLAEITAKEGKLFKGMTAEKEKLTSVTALANQVAANVAAKKEEVGKEAEALLNEIKNIVTENGKLVLKLPKGKEGLAVIEAIKADLTNVDAAVADAQAAYDKGAFMDALNKIKAAKAKAETLNAEMKETLTKARIRF